MKLSRVHIQKCQMIIGFVVVLSTTKPILVCSTKVQYTFTISTNYIQFQLWSWFQVISPIAIMHIRLNAKIKCTELPSIGSKDHNWNFLNSASNPFIGRQNNRALSSTFKHMIESKTKFIIVMLRLVYVTKNSKQRRIRKVPTVHNFVPFFIHSF